MKNNYICFIPARAGSKRIKNKNIVKINKKKLFDYTLEQALKVKKINKILISTNIKNLTKIKDNKIITIKRPNYLCDDKSSTESAILHSIKSLNFLKKKNIVIVLLQPTSPLRDKFDIENSIKEFEKKNFDSLFSAYYEKLFLWRQTNGSLKSFTYNYKRRERSQVIKPFLVENGAIFLFKLNGFLKFKNRLFGRIGFSIMTKKNSIEIDYPEDIKILQVFQKFKIFY